ncbi:MAG: hypothetical protein RIS24_537 [Verrucomicrobiota bacterium]|jgi:hypothetical protein
MPEYLTPVNGWLYALSLMGFLILPPVLLGLRWFRPARFPWRRVLLLNALVGWALFNGLVHFRAARWAQSLRENASAPPTEFSQAWMDGQPQRMALYLGWAYALGWACPWLMAYGSWQQHRGREKTAAGHGLRPRKGLFSRATRGSRPS